MLNNSLVSLLKSLNKKELGEFEDFVNSPFFNKKRPVIKLFRYLRNFHPGFDNAEQLDRKNIYHALYPGKPYNYGVMKNIIYELNLLGEKYLELLHYSENRSEQYRNLLEEVLRRDLGKSFNKNLKNAESLLKSAKQNDVYFRNNMDLELLKFNFHIKKAGITGKPSFERNAGNLFISYVLIKFFKINYNNLVDMVNYGKIEYIPFLDEVLNFINRNSQIEPIVLLYYNKFMLLYKENETYYRNFKSLVKQQIHNLDRKEIYHTYVNLLNFCYGKIISGEWSYYNDLFEIYNEMLSNEVYSSSEKNYFDAIHFRLGAETGLKLKKFDWTKQFIKQHSEKLNPELRSNEINIAFANYYFMKKNYDKAQNYLAQTQIKTVYDKIYIYIIQTMLYYETGQMEPLISEIDTIRHFISNDKILSFENINSFKKYINYLNEIVKLNINEHDDKGAEVSELNKNLDSEKGILEKHWLIEKLIELKK